MNKLGFFEMECVSLDEIAEFEGEMTCCGCRFVSDKSMMNDHIAESYSCFGEFEGTQYDDEEFVTDESWHGFDSLREIHGKVRKHLIPDSTNGLAELLLKSSTRNIALSV